MDNRNLTDMATARSNRSLVCDFVKGLLPSNLIAEVKAKIKSDPLFAAEVAYYEALHDIIKVVKDAFGDQSKEAIDDSIERHYKNIGKDDGEVISFSEILIKEYQYRSLEFEPLNLEESSKTIEKINSLKLNIVFLDNTIFDTYNHLIPDYINDNIDSTNRIAIEKLAESNPLFKREIEHQRELSYTVRRIEREALKLQLAKLRTESTTSTSAKQMDNVFTKIAGRDSTTSQYRQSARPASGKRNTYISIAAVVTIVFGSAVLFYFYAGKESHQEVANNQVVSPQPSTPPSSTGSSTDTVNQVVSPVIIKTERLLVERQMVINPFKFSSQNFGFAGSQELTVKLFSYGNESHFYGTGTLYVYVSDTVKLFLNDTAALRLYVISETDVEQAEENIEAGLYLYMGDNFYLLLKDNKMHSLQPINSIQSEYLKLNL